MTHWNIMGTNRKRNADLRARRHLSGRARPRTDCAGWAAGSALLLAGCAPALQPGASAGAGEPVPTFPTEAAAISFAVETAREGEAELQAVARLQRAGFRCRVLAPDEYSDSDPGTARLVSCYTSADRTAAGYRLVYVTLAIDRQGRIARSTTGSYPVVYKNLRTDERGRVIVVPATDR